MARIWIQFDALTRSREGDRRSGENASQSETLISLDLEPNAGHLDESVKLSSNK